MRIFHLALPDEWALAVEAGTYRISTRGRTLAEEGFVHCSTAEQVEGVRAAFYADVEHLLVLTVETDLLTSPWRFEDVPGSATPYPHVHGPLDLAAVVEVREAG